MKEKLATWTSKNFYSTKDTAKRIKRLATDWE